jgi:integrase
MPPAPTGQVIRRTSGAWALRFRAYGQRRYVTLGTSSEGWTRRTAHTELQNILADVRRGIWCPVEPEPARPRQIDQVFGEFATKWFEASRYEWQPKTACDYEWQLRHHLLPFFENHRLSQITIAEVDRYRGEKVRESVGRAEALEGWRKRVEETQDAAARRDLARERPPRGLSAVSINKTITRLGQILEVALEYGLIDRNTARGKRRRLKVSKPSAVWLDRAEHIEALLDAASALDQHARVKGGHDQKGGLVYRRALLATFVLAGLRIGEMTALRWRDVDLAGNRIMVRESKTDAGTRLIDLLPALRDELTAYKAQALDIAPSAFVFPSAKGTRMTQENIRSRVLGMAVEKANKKLTSSGDVPLPEGLTPHKLRHTFASILVALGVDPGSVMDQLGHVDPGFTLRVYRHGMRRHLAARQRLRILVGHLHRPVCSSCPLLDLPLP